MFLLYYVFCAYYVFLVFLFFCCASFEKNTTKLLFYGNDRNIKKCHMRMIRNHFDVRCKIMLIKIMLWSQFIHILKLWKMKTIYLSSIKIAWFALIIFKLELLWCNKWKNIFEGTFKSIVFMHTRKASPNRQKTNNSISSGIWWQLLTAIIEHIFVSNIKPLLYKIPISSSVSNVMNVIQIASSGYLWEYYLRWSICVKTDMYSSYLDFL